MAVSLDRVWRRARIVADRLGFVALAGDFHGVEIEFLRCLARHSGESRNPVFVVTSDSALTASLRFSARIHASGSLFFACTKKSDQKKCTPGAAPSALRVRKVRPGFARWASCPFANSRASLRATLRAIPA